MEHEVVSLHGTQKIIIAENWTFKEEVYAVFNEQGSTMKDWFLAQTPPRCDEHRQPTLKLLLSSSIHDESTQNQRFS